MPPTSQRSPVLCETSTPHTWPSSELLSAPAMSPASIPPTTNATMSDHQLRDQAAETSQSVQEDSSASDTSSNASVETPRTASTPHSDPLPFAESGRTEPSETQPESSSNIVPEANSENTTQIEANQQESESTANDTTPEITMPPPPPPDDLGQPPPPRNDVPEWVKYEEDMSVPSEDELKEIEAKEREANAADIKAMEKSLFTDIDDPELRPVKKIRLSWTVKGVRGTREKPNRARIMVSPTFQYEGQHWNIKFFPRGNKSRSSMAAFIRCSNVPLSRTNEESLHGSFRCYAGAADDEFLEEKVNIILTPTEPEEKETEPQNGEDIPNPPPPSLPVAITAESTSDSSDSSADSERQPPRRNRDDDDSSSDNSSDEEDDIVIPSQLSPNSTEQEDFRVSAQLGMVVYNPNEPRTCHEASSEHQFCPHEDDWGWDSLISRWEEIHRRKTGQRQALLRNDTLVIDAYIRIYDDPSKALFWHSSAGESQWDSKLLAGYYPMGTRLLYHSPAVAGLTAWSLLAPFRKLIQGVDAGRWRFDTSAKPRSLLANLQLMLFQMRQMKKEETYIHLDNIICEMMGPGESFEDVKGFWEVLRRSMELELEGEGTSINRLAEIFGQSDSESIPVLPVQDMHNIQKAIDQGFSASNFKGDLPNFLPLMLNRQSFDSLQREWKLHHDRVRLTDEIDVSRFSRDGDGKFTLYGFVVHDGERNSGKFFTIVRPSGPGGKWLAFSDGNGNKVFSHTRKSLEEFEGLEGDELKNFTSTRQTAYMAMYIRTSCLSEYLVPSMEPYSLPIWLKPFIEEPYHTSPDNFDRTNEVRTHSQVKVEIFWDVSVVGHEGTLNMFNMKTGKRSRDSSFHQSLTCFPAVTFKILKEKIASILELEERAVRVWTMNYYRLGQYSKAYMHEENLSSTVGQAVVPGETLCLWLAIRTEHDAAIDDHVKELFATIDGTYVEVPPSITEAESIHDSSNSNEETQEVSTAITNDTQPESNSTNTDATVPTASADNLATEGANLAVEETTAGPDAEQASIEQAVLADVQNTAAGLGDNPVNGVVVRANELAVPQTTSSPDTLAGASDLENTDNQTGLAMALHNLNSQDSVAVTEGANVIASENNLIGSATINGNEVTWRPITSTVTASGMETTIVTVETALGEIPGDLSAEDAALISSMIAADLEAAERERVNLQRVRTGSESRDGGEVIDSRPSTPHQQAGHVYGFLQFFDTEKQMIVTKSPFSAERSGKVSDMVRKYLQYDPEKTFQVWRREGPCGAASVELEMTFKDIDLQDGGDVIVGDVLPQSRIDELKQKGEFFNPGPLIKYIVMTRHRHPVLSRTSDGPVEVGGFGTDYYRGPLIRGQRQGKDCLLITSNGEIYQGPMLAGRKSGAQGKMTYQNGDVYTGDWADDLRQGQGEFIEKRTGNRYVGGYVDDKRWGRGVTYWEVADQQASLCQICYFEDVDCLFYECGHVCACYNCAKECDCCPICRKTVRAVVKMYRA